MSVTSIELDPQPAAVAAAGDWPSSVDLRVGDALEFLDGSRRFDLIFADARGGKTEGSRLRSDHQRQEMTFA